MEEVERIIKEFGSEKNYGLNLELEKAQQSDEDWVFGSTNLSCSVEIPEEEREMYLPKGEIQRGREDFMDCATRGPINILEAKFNYMYEKRSFPFDHEFWLRGNGYVTENGIEFSDRFIAILSGTTKQGNSMKAPLDAIRKNGLIPKAMLPKGDLTWDEYHNPESVTDEMRKLGQDFLERFVINYERVNEADFEKLLTVDFLDVAGYAWPEPVGETYPRTENTPNHVFVGFRNPPYLIFDNYLDRNIAGDFIKKLAKDYNFLEYGYRLLVNAKEQKDSWFSFIRNFCKKYKINLFQ